MSSESTSSAINSNNNVKRSTGGRLGNADTRTQNKELGEYLENSGYTIIGGAGVLKEEYLPGPNGARKGSNYVDITAEKDGAIIRINTVDTYADGSPTKREAKAAASINQKTPNDREIILIPKGSGLGDLPDKL